MQNEFLLDDLRTTPSIINFHFTLVVPSSAESFLPRVSPFPSTKDTTFFYVFIEPFHKPASHSHIKKIGGQENNGNSTSTVYPRNDVDKVSRVIPMG